MLRDEEVEMAFGVHTSTNSMKRVIGKKAHLSALLLNGSVVLHAWFSCRVSKSDEHVEAIVKVSQ